MGAQPVVPVVMGEAAMRVVRRRVRRSLRSLVGVMVIETDVVLYCGRVRGLLKCLCRGKRGGGLGGGYIWSWGCVVRERKS